MLLSPAHVSLSDRLCPTGVSLHVKQLSLGRVQAELSDDEDATFHEPAQSQDHCCLFTFKARLETKLAPKTCAMFAKQLPFKNKVIPCALEWRSGLDPIR